MFLRKNISIHLPLKVKTFKISPFECNNFNRIRGFYWIPKNLKIPFFDTSHSKFKLKFQVKNTRAWKLKCSVRKDSNPAMHFYQGWQSQRGRLPLQIFSSYKSKHLLFKWPCITAAPLPPLSPHLSKNIIWTLRRSF